MERRKSYPRSARRSPPPPGAPGEPAPDASSLLASPSEAALLRAVLEKPRVCRAGRNRAAAALPVALKNVQMPHQVLVATDTFDGTSWCKKGAFGAVREYFNEASGERLVVKTFLGDARRSAASFAVERGVWREIETFGSALKALVVPVVDFLSWEAEENAHLVVMRKLDSVFTDHWRDSVGASGELYATAHALLEGANRGKLAYVDATFSNIGTLRGAPRLLDLGGFYLRDHGDQHMVPSYMPPFMWRTNKASTGSFCEFAGRLYSLPELRCVGYYALLCSAVAAFLEGSHKAKDVFFMHTTYLREWFARGKTFGFPGALARFKTLLAEIRAPEARPLVKALFVFLSLDATEMCMRAAARAAAKALRGPNVRKTSFKSIITLEYT